MRIFFGTYVVLAIFLAWPSARAQDSIQMDTIRVQEEAEDADSVITGEVMEDKQVRDLEDTFRETPEVAVGGSSRVAQKIYVRGLEDTNLNITVDGARQSGYLFHHQGRLNIDPELLKRVEVDAGTGDALAGPGALGGAVRFQTKDPEDLLFPGQKSGAYLKTWYGSNNDEKGGTIALFTQPNEYWSGMIYGSFAESLNSRVGEQSIPYTKGRPRAGLAKIAVRPNSFHKLTAATNFTSDNAKRLVRADFGFAPTQPVTDKVFETLNTTLSHEYNPGSQNLQLRTELYTAHNKLKHSNATSSTTADFRSQGLSVKNHLHRDWGRVVTGFDYNLDEAHAKNQVRGQTEKGKILGLFAQGTWLLSESWKFSAGARYDDYHLETINDHELEESHLSPNGSLQYTWNRNLSTRLGWSQAFRGPVPVEAFLLANATSVAPVEDLKGTVAETTELATKFEVADSSWEVILFDTQLRHALESQIASGTIIRSNADNTLYSQGYTIKYERAWDRLRSSVYYSHTDTEYGSKPLGYQRNYTRGVSLGDRLGLNLNYRQPERQLMYSWSSLFVMRLKDVPAGYVEQPGYDVHDLTVTWFASDRGRVGLALHNVFDRKYVAQGSVFANTSGSKNFLYEPGRDLRVSFSYVF